MNEPMRRVPAALLVVATLAMLTVGAQTSPRPTYVKKATRVETILATLKASGLPTLEGKWHVVGPFDNTDGRGFDTAYPPEKEIDLKKTYPGKGGERAAWKEFAAFRVGRVNDLKRFADNDDACAYLFTEIDVGEVVELPVALGSDDTLTVWLNGERLLAENVVRGAAPDQNQATLKLKPGKNRLLVKVCNAGGEWAFYVCPELPKSIGGQVLNQLARDFPIPKPAAGAQASAEADYYRIVTLPVPDDMVLEVGGLAFRPDGKLLACTRRGEIWLIENADSDDPSKVRFKLWADGLHEALGLLVDGKDVFVVQRPELTRLRDTNGDDVADEFVTVCDKWGVSGDYHEFAFGPARDRHGNFFVTLNVGFGGGHQSKAPWRGWCVKITPKGELVPFATGLRSPNGVNLSPDGDLFYCDNQGEWVATNKMHHVREGDYFGHAAGLRWVKQSPFAHKLPETHVSGMLYDGQPPPTLPSPPGGEGRVGGRPSGLPPHSPPCIWFPYSRMGQSATEPIWDTTGGKFGPFAGQCFVGDQTKSSVMRVALEKVNGRYQGACFPFRSGLQCGVNRLAFGPDGSLFAGQTSRGWGSVGGKPHGLQRLVWTGKAPFEMHMMKLTKTGFEVTFTKPLDDVSAKRQAAFAVQSFTYHYWSTYGSPEVDRRAEKVSGVTVSADRRTVSLAVGGLRPGRVYELQLDGIKSSEGDAVLHSEAFYTLNELR